MDPRWLEAAGRLSLYLFYALVGTMTISLSGHALYPTVRPRRRAPPVDRFLTEYLGNVDSRVVEDRRRLQETRALVDRIQAELRRRRVPPHEREAFMTRLRETIRFEQRFLDLSRYDLRAEEEALHVRRLGLADAFHALLADPPQEIVARIKNGVLPTDETP